MADDYLYRPAYRVGPDGPWTSAPHQPMQGERGRAHYAGLVSEMNEAEPEPGDVTEAWRLERTAVSWEPVGSGSDVESETPRRPRRAKCGGTGDGTRTLADQVGKPNPYDPDRS